MSDLAKVRSDIKDLESKKQALLTAIQNDIDAVNKNILKAFCQIGQKAYELSKSGTDSMEALQPDFAQVNDLKADIEAKNKKISDIGLRYDEEIDLLKKLIPEQPAPAAPPAGAPAGGKGFCMSCGTAYTVGVDVFCANCGTKVGAPAPEAAPAQPSKCTVCGTAYKPGVDVFCMSCGKKLQ